MYSLRFCLRQHCSTSYALVNLAETIMKTLDDGNFACDIFVDLQKIFDTMDPSILLSKLRHYGICGLANKSFESYSAEAICINQWFCIRYVKYHLWCAERIYFKALTFSNLH